MIRKETYVSQAVLEELERIVVDSEVMQEHTCFPKCLHV